MPATNAVLSLVERQKYRHFPESTFTGAYEKLGNVLGTLEEQWLWQHRHLMRGVVLDMSTPRHFHEFIYELPTVSRVLVSDLDAPVVEKMGFTSRTDVIGDFCASPPPMPPESVDTLLSLSIMEHVADPRAFMKNLASVLRPGGHLFMWTPFAYIEGHMGDQGPDYWRFGRDAHRMLAKEVGLEVVEMGQFLDMGQYYEYELGHSVAAKSWHRGVPINNWCISRKP